jgi:hypothetical protein
MLEFMMHKSKNYFISSMLLLVSSVVFAQQGMEKLPKKFKFSGQWNCSGIAGIYQPNEAKRVEKYSILVVADKVCDTAKKQHQSKKTSYFEPVKDNTITKHTLEIKFTDQDFSSKDANQPPLPAVCTNPPKEIVDSYFKMKKEEKQDITVCDFESIANKEGFTDSNWPSFLDIKKDVHEVRAAPEKKPNLEKMFCKYTCTLRDWGLLEVLQ